MTSQLNLNDRAALLTQQCIQRQQELRIAVSEQHGISVLDFGVSAKGGLAAGLQLARICMADLAEIRLQAPTSDRQMPMVTVQTDHPLQACLLSQYAGWKLATDDFFAMGSGPIRIVAAQEELFREFPAGAEGRECIGVLECGTLPTESAVKTIRDAVGIDQSVALAVAPTASQAGNVQVVARSVETAMHKLHEIGFPVGHVISGFGAAPLPPVAKNDLEGIGRTNDSILYGATVHLWVNCDDDVIQQFGPQTPSDASDAHGEPFLKLFQEANQDFYALDKALFSPAVVVFHSLNSGRSFHFGRLMPELVARSFELA